MSDLTGYIGPDVADTDYAFNPLSSELPPLSLLAADVNTSITTLMENMVFQGWTNPTLGDGDQDGTLASCTVNTYIWPFHAPGSGDASCVPDTFGGALVGTFNGYEFIFYDPLAFPPDADPTGGTFEGFPIIGVPCASTLEGTIDAFAGLASANTPWDWSFTGEAGTVTAYHTGPSFNVDGASAAGFWAPAVDYWTETGSPIGGGWNVYSTPAPVTGDQMKLTIYEGDFGGIAPAFDIEMPAGSGQIVTYQLTNGHYNYGVGGSQLFFRQIPGEYYTGIGQNNIIASALNVPSEMGPVTFTVASVTNPNGSVPVMISTATAHGLAMQDRVLISGAMGATQVNGAWWVAKVLSDTELWVSLDPLVFIFGTGASYSGGGQVFQPPSGTLFNISAVQNDTGNAVLFTTTAPHGFQPGDFVETSSIGGIPTLDGEWSVAAVPTPTTLEIATLDAGILDGNGTTYTAASATLASGVFQAMVTTSSLNNLLYSDATVACQGVFGSFSGQGSPLRTLATYTMAIHPIFNGYTTASVGGADGITTALKPVLLAPYIALRIATGQEARIAGTFWNTFVQLQVQEYGTMETFNDVPYMAWVPYSGMLNATLFLRAAAG